MSSDSAPIPATRLHISERPGPVIELVGDLDPYTAPRLEEAIDQSIPTREDRVVIDVDALDFVDSWGLRTIAECNKRVADGGGELIVRHPSGALLRLLTVTGLADQLEIDSS